MKKSFIIHIDSLGILDELTDEQCGQLFRLIYSYHNPEKPKETQTTQVVKLAFYPFKSQFDRDLQTYSNVVERNKTNGSKGGRPKKINPKKPKKADSDNDSKSDSVNDNVIVNETIKKEKRVVARKTPLPTTEYSTIVDFWLKEFHPDFTFGAAQGKSVNSIIKKLKTVFPNEPDIVSIFKMMCLKLPEWYKGKDLLVIDSKFNEIITEIKTNQNGNKNIDSNGKPISKYHN